MGLEMTSTKPNLDSSNTKHNATPMGNWSGGNWVAFDCSILKKGENSSEVSSFPKASIIASE